ncbi:MAG: FAD-dependent oxidoreductase [Eubacterium sp.]|nr:FAD-dependent oxidoreductase [Eubacterium sp.]
MDNSNKYDVIVVGAGLAGLSCAYELSEKGKKVLVIEAQSYAGGRTSSFDDNGMQVESGLHRYIGYYSALPRLLKKCGVKIGDIVTWEEKVDILIKNKNKKLVLGLAPLFGPIKTVRGVLGNNDILTIQDKLSLIPFFVSGFSSYIFTDNLDNYTVAEYANLHNVTEKGKRLILEPLSSGIFFMPPENYSAYAFFGLFAPAIGKFYKMRIGAFLGGMTDIMCNPIVDKIRSLGGEFVFGEAVEEVIIENDAVVGVKSKNGNEYFSNQTVIATTLPSAKSILALLKKNINLRKLFELPTMSACTLQLEMTKPALEKDITTFGPGTDMVSFAEQSRTTFRNKNGRLSVILGNAKDYANKDAEEILETVINEMDSLGVHLDKENILNYRKVAEKDEFYSLDKGNQKLRPTQNTGIQGLTLAGDYTLTPSFATMEGAVISGELAAKECLKNSN